MNRRVARRIDQLGEKGVRAAVVVYRDKRASRVFRLEKYAKMKELPKKHKPWTARNSGKTADPLGAVEGRVLEPVRRERMYETKPLPPLDKEKLIESMKEHARRARR
jgi:hypothetical protein